MAETLKPCPFCGGEAVIQQFNTNPRLPFRIICACGAEIRGSKGESAADVVKRWNRRSERTCRMDAPIDGEYRCGECGHLNRETYRADKGWYPPEYCAHCGARVVEEEA